MTSRSRFALIALVVVVAAVIIGYYVTHRSTDTSTITIGAVLPLTGDLSNYSVASRKALELALEQQNAKGGINGKQLALTVEDSRGVAAQAVSAFNKLVDVNRAVACVGPITSPEVHSVAPVANQKHVSIISPSSTSVDITNAGPYVFRTINVDSIETEAFAAYVNHDLHITTVGILADQASGTMSYANSFAKYFAAQGGTVAITEVLPQGSLDYRSSISKVLAKKPAALYLAGVSNEIGELVRQIRSINSQIPLLSYQSAEDKRVIEIAGDSVNGLVFSSTTLPESALGAAHATFVSDFSKKFGEEPGIFGAESYDAFNIVAEALRRCGDDTIKLAGCIGQTLKFPGASGEITFDANGDVHKPIAFYRYSNKTPVVLGVGK
jgi:branched-chain amino acid transport system substrate-binding protein